MPAKRGISKRGGYLDVRVRVDVRVAYTQRPHLVCIFRVRLRLRLIHHKVQSNSTFL